MSETSGGPPDGRAFDRITGGYYRARAEITEGKSDIGSRLDWASNLALEDDSVIKSCWSQAPDRTQTQLCQGHAEKWVVR
jgi:hypothetical protein